MATDANQVAEGGENEELETKTVEGAENEGAGTQEEESPYAELAQQMGWVPRDQFDGPPEAWKPADKFILDGRDIQRETSRELKTVRQQLDTIAKTSASIVEQKAQERAEQLFVHYQKAVDDGDPKKAFELAGEIKDLTTPVTGPQRTPEADEWVERNSSWFNKPGYEYQSARAREITDLLSRQGITDPAAQLKITDGRLRQEFPDLFKQGMNGRKPPPGVNAPAGRTTGGGSRAKGFSDMPPEAQKIAKDMADRGVIASTDDYAKNYFANEQGKR